MLLQGSYDYRLVALSVVLAMFASYAALDLAGRVTAAHRLARALWLAGGAASMGIGIWAMHYVGMLAFSLRVPILYHYPTVILSLLAAVAASAVALFTVSRESMAVRSIVSGSLVMGGGIAAMHYIGMAAMRLPAMMEYRWSLVLVSLVLAVVISWVALLLAFQVRHEEQASPRKLLSALIMGSAIPLMHYTGMWAVNFRESNLALNVTHSGSTSILGVAVISTITFVLLVGVIVTSYLDRMLFAQRTVLEGAREGEIYFRTLAEAVPEMIWTARPDGAVDFFNSRWTDYTGLSVKESSGSGWEPVLHPDDLDACQSAWRRSLQTGETYQIEYRFRRASDGAYHWFLGRVNPIRDKEGQIFKWFGTCTDIDDQKHNQQILEQEIKERTEELADANTRLQEEMMERDHARRELDEQNENVAGPDGAVASRDFAGQDGRTLAELHEPGGDLRRGAGLCAEDFSHQPRIGLAAQFRARSGGDRGILARVPTAEFRL